MRYSNEQGVLSSELMKPVSEGKFVEVYREYAPKIFKYMYFRVSSREDAEDLSSRVFTKTWDYMISGNEVDNMRAFLYRVAHNLVVDFYKTSKRDKEVSIHAFEDTVDIPEEKHFIDDLETKSLVSEVEDKLDKLSDAYREIIVLRYINDMSITEIANVTGMTENNVSVKLHRAVEKLRSIV
jgi:RNA polymerase sigma-70 factor, ECF subfamily